MILRLTKKIKKFDRVEIESRQVYPGSELKHIFQKMERKKIKKKMDK
jgi:hypothetical protein